MNRMWPDRLNAEDNANDVTFTRAHSLLKKISWGGANDVTFGCIYSLLTKISWGGANFVTFVCLSSLLTKISWGGANDVICERSLGWFPSAANRRAHTWRHSLCLCWFHSPANIRAYKWRHSLRLGCTLRYAALRGPATVVFFVLLNNGSYVLFFFAKFHSVLQFFFTGISFFMLFLCRFIFYVNIRRYLYLTHNYLSLT